MILCFAGLPLFLAAAAAPPRLPQAAIGIYHWGGEHSRSVDQGVDQIAAIGARIARVAISARYRADYNQAEGCISGFSLGRVMQEDSGVFRALTHPAIEVTVITAFDGVGYPDCSTPRFLSPSFYTSTLTQAMEQEYSDFTYSLANFNRYSGKRFILANWEGDNQIYCGSSFLYVRQPSFRGKCDSAYPSLYPGNRSPSESLEGMRLWMIARSRGIHDGMRRARESGFTGVEVLSAVEFNSVRILTDNGLPDVLHNLPGQVPVDYLAYSSWESINTPELPAAGTLAADLEEVRAVAGDKPVLIGEAGYARSLWGQDSLVRLGALHSAAVLENVDYLIHWNLYDTQDSDTPASSTGTA